MSNSAQHNPDAGWTRLIGEALRAQRSGDRRWRFDLVDGPNMSNLGVGGRDVRTYGAVTSLAALQDGIVAMGEGLGLVMSAFSANHEGSIVEHIYEAASSVDAFLINPAALTRYGMPTRIALADVRRPFIELHFANVAALGWEGGITTPVATAVVMGFRHYSYMGALFGLACALDCGEVRDWPP
jgi:3-dehydroquinate dehydratase II